MREISKTQKLQIATIIIACSLIFYAIGIATNFFANPMFSMFFIVSEETAHNIVTYLAAGIAIAIIIMGLSIALIQKRKIAQTKEANTEKNFVQTPSIHDQKITKYLESSSAEKENQSVKQEPIIQLTKQSRTQISAQLNTDRISITNREEAMSEGKRICEICKEKFRAPLYQIDYSSSQLELIRICPYCRQSLDSQPENTLDDWWVRTVNSPDSALGK